MTTAEKLQPLREQVWEAMRDGSIRRRSRSWTEYERGKKLLEGMNLDPMEYYNAIEIVAAWVNV